MTVVNLVVVMTMFAGGSGSFSCDVLREVFPWPSLNSLKGAIIRKNLTLRLAKALVFISPGFRSNLKNVWRLMFKFFFF